VQRVVTTATRGGDRERGRRVVLVAGFGAAASGVVVEPATTKFPTSPAASSVIESVQTPLGSSPRKMSSDHSGSSGVATMPLENTRSVIAASAASSQRVP
jgi:hypothetical protein